MTQKIDLTGKIALVTGASRGIGAAVSLAYAKAGAHVILLARTVGGLEEVDDRIKAVGGSATLMPLDLLKLDDLDKLGPTILERFSGLDILVGNAGMLGPLTPAHQATPKEWDKVMTLNFMANVRLVHSLDPLLRASKAGRVIFTGSGTAYRPRAYWGPYRASKAALHMFAQTYAAECKVSNMRVNIVDPGPIQTDILNNAYPGGYLEGDEKTPEAVVETYLGLASDLCTSHGEVVCV